MSARFGLGFPWPKRGVHCSFTPSKSKAKPSLSKVKPIFLNKVIELLELVDLEKSDLRRDNRIVFLCGGYIDPAQGPLKSVRDALLRSLPDRHKLGEARVILAETATEKLPGSPFSNLLDLEEYIAAVADGVILIVESAGSICELGAFVKTEEIADKLVIVISNDHDNQHSFIKLGALKYFEDAHDQDGEVHPFHWQVAGDGIVIIKPYVMAATVIAVRSSIENVRSRGKLNISTLGDRMLFSLSLCHLIRGARIQEIKQCYEAIGKDITTADIHKQFSALEICGLVKPVSHGKKLKYFIPLTPRMPLRIAFKPNVKDRDRDTLRWIGEISSLIAKHEPTRLKIFQEHHNAA